MKLSDSQYFTASTRPTHLIFQGQQQYIHRTGFFLKQSQLEAVLRLHFTNPPDHQKTLQEMVKSIYKNEKYFILMKMEIPSSIKTKTIKEN